MNARVTSLLNNMTDAEIRQRLVEYMESDVRLMPRLVAVEVRLSSGTSGRNRYDVILIDEDGGETPVKFRDRCSRLLYIYTLLHPQGFQRRSAAANDCRELRQLFSQLYFADSDALVRTIESTGYDHFISHYVAQSRNALRQASPLATPFVIDYPQAHNGKLLIPFVAQGGTVILDASLSKH
jgi:hypothetical protein